MCHWRLVVFITTTHEKQIYTQHRLRGKTGRKICLEVVFCSSPTPFKYDTHVGSYGFSFAQLVCVTMETHKKEENGEVEAL